MCTETVRRKRKRNGTHEKHELSYFVIISNWERAPSAATRTKQNEEAAAAGIKNTTTMKGPNTQKKEHRKTLRRDFKKEAKTSK